MKNLKITRNYGSHQSIYDANTGMPFGRIGTSSNILNRPVYNCFGEKIGIVYKDYCGNKVYSSNMGGIGNKTILR